MPPETQVRALITDRDRLAARLASLERNLDDMTGSIKQQVTQKPPPAAKPAAPNALPTTQQSVASRSPPPAAAKAEPPVIAALATPALAASTRSLAGHAVGKSGSPCCGSGPTGADPHGGTAGRTSRLSNRRASLNSVSILAAHPIWKCSICAVER